MRKKNRIVYENFNKILGLKAWNVRQSYGSSIFMEFGEEIKYKMKIKRKMQIQKRGEWMLWIQMCSWKIDEKLIPIAGCEDSRKTIEKALKKIENKKLINIEILNNAYDMKLKFENSIILNLFSIYTEKESEAESWILFTPNMKALSAGPGTLLEYENSGGIKYKSSKNTTKALKKKK